MGMKIESGGGNGFLVRVSDDQKLMTRAVSVSAEHHVNHIEGDCYYLTFNQSPTAGDDCIFYLENTDTKQDLIMEGFGYAIKDATAVDAELYFELNSAGVRNSGTAVPLVNGNTGSGRVAAANAEQGADLNGGASTIVTGSEIMRIPHPNVQDVAHHHVNFEADIVLTPGKALTIWADDAGATYYFDIVIWFTVPRE